MQQRSCVYMRGREERQEDGRMRHVRGAAEKNACGVGSRGDGGVKRSTCGICEPAGRGTTMRY